MIALVLFFFGFHLLAGLLGMIHPRLGAFVLFMGWSGIASVLIGAWAFIIGLLLFFGTWIYCGPIPEK